MPVAQFDANVNLRVNVQQAEKDLKKVETKLKGLERGTISRNKRNQGLASNLITGSKAANTNVGARILRQNLAGQKAALKLADARVEKELRLAAAQQRQETILRALNRAGGANNELARKRVEAAKAASAEAPKSLRIQNAVNTLLEKELQSRREINRLANASSAAKSAGSRRGREIQGLAKNLKLPAAQEKRLLKLNAAYVKAAEKGQADIAKAINRKIETELKGLRKIETKRKRDQKKADADALRGIKKRENAEKRATAKRKRDNEQLRNNIGAAAGFPLLFGGGAGSVVGGVAGAGIGSLFGAGFGVSILGSALGQAFDKLAVAALDTAKAFSNVTDNLDEVLKKLGETNTPIGQRAAFAASQGLQNQAAAAVRQRAVEVLGNNEVQRLQQLALSAREFDNALERLGLTFQGWISGIVKGAADLISGTQPKAPLTGEQEAQGKIFLKEADIKNIKILEKFAKESGKKLSPELQKRLKTLKEELAVLKEQALAIEGKTDAERQLLKITRQRLDLAKELADAEVSVAERALTERRDVLAGDKGAIAIKRAEGEVNRINAEINANATNREPGWIKRGLELNTQLIEAQKKLNVARANGANNVLTAERQITKETQAQINLGLKLRNQRVASQLTLNDLERGTVENFEERRTYTVEIQKSERAILKAKQEQELVGIRENELLKETLTRQEEERGLLRDQQRLALKRLDTANAARLDRRQAIKDARVIKTLEAEINAERLKRSTDPNYMMSFATAGLGFFSESAKLEADQIADRTAKLELYNEQLAKLKQRRDEAIGKVSGDKLFDLNTEIQDLELLRNNFERLQPAIDQAALAQARFNDAFAAVSPAVNSLVSGFREVVAGTKSAEEAFADFLNTIADQLAQTAATLIAQYIAIGIARTFAGIPGGSSGSDFSQFGTNTTGVPTNFIGSGLSGFAGLFADGGTLGAGKWGIAGEAGPEIVSGPATITPMTGGETIVNITVNSSGGSTSTSQGEKAKEAQALGRMVEASVVSIINREKRPGGLLTR